MPFGLEQLDASTLAHHLLRSLLAEQAPAAPAQSPWTTLGFIGVMVVIFYLMLWRPQQKQAKEHKAMLAALKKGDVVVTNGGLVGRIHSVSEKSVMLELTRDVRVRVLMGSIGGKAPEGLLEDPERSDSKAGKDEKK